MSVSARPLPIIIFEHLETLVRNGEMLRGMILKRVRNIYPMLALKVAVHLL